MNPRILELRKNVLDRNDMLARGLRDEFQRAGVFVVNLVSSPGSGKTSFLESTLGSLKARGYRVAALTGDLQTDNDAQRLLRSGALVRQISTGGNCHLEADMIERHLDEWKLESLDFLFIENVGNLVCTAGYDLGEQMRVVMLATTEGEDKPGKYPPLFSSGDAFVISKIDLAEAAEFDRLAAHRSLRDLRSEVPIFETSAKKNLGMEEWLNFLVEKSAKVPAA